MRNKRAAETCAHLEREEQNRFGFFNHPTPHPPPPELRFKDSKCSWGLVDFHSPVFWGRNKWRPGDSGDDGLSLELTHAGRWRRSRHTRSRCDLNVPPTMMHGGQIRTQSAARSLGGAGWDPHAGQKREGRSKRGRYRSRIKDEFGRKPTLYFFKISRLLIEKIEKTAI